jgi:hypothetical protein
LSFVNRDFQKTLLLALTSTASVGKTGILARTRRTLRKPGDFRIGLATIAPDPPNWNSEVRAALFLPKIADKTGSRRTSEGIAQGIPIPGNH